MVSRGRLARGIFVVCVRIDYRGNRVTMGLASMTIHRVKKLLSWVFAVVILGLLASGLFWVVVESGWLT